MYKLQQNPLQPPVTVIIRVKLAMKLISVLQNRIRKEFFDTKVVKLK